MSYIKLAGGLTNDMFVYIDNRGHKTHILRKYKSNQPDKSEEIRIIDYYSKLGIVPRILNTSTDGRTEEYFDGRHPMYVDMFYNDIICTNIVKIICTIHTNKVDGCDKTIIDIINTYIYSISAKNIKIDDDVIILIDQFKQKINKYKKNLVMCHNDIHRENIMISFPYNGDIEIKFIDFEFCTLNYYAYDLANFLVVTEIFMISENYLGNIEEYIKSFTDKIIDCYSYIMNMDKQKIAADIEEFKIFSHMIWYLWALDLFIITNDVFYLNYSTDRLNDIKKLKKYT